MADDKEVLRGLKEVLRGLEKEVLRGDALVRPEGPHRAAQDIFRQASELGGMLVVAVVTPLPHPSPAVPGGDAAAFAALGRIAEAREQEKADKPGDKE